MSSLKDLGNKIKLLRIQNGYTQGELANLLGYTSRSTIAKIEKGLIDIPQSKINQISDLFSVPQAFLLSVEDLTKNTVSLNSANFNKSYELEDEDFKAVLNILEKLKK